MRDGTFLEVEPDNFAEWLGFIERDVARSWGSVLNAREVPLSTYAKLEAWRSGELASWNWIDKSKTFVGFLVAEGVFAVVERGKPLLKRKPSPNPR